MTEQIKEPPTWWQRVLYSAWTELRHANKGNRRQDPIFDESPAMRYLACVAAQTGKPLFVE